MFEYILIKLLVKIGRKLFKRCVLVIDSNDDCLGITLTNNKLYRDYCLNFNIIDYN